MGTAPSLDTLPLPRRVAIVQLLCQALRIERELVALYRTVGTRAEPAPLATAFTELGRAKAARVSALEPVVRALGADAESMASPWPPATVGRVEAIALAFRGEREVESLYREALSLLEDPRQYPDLEAFAAEAAQHRGRFRELYLRYS